MTLIIEKPTGAKLVLAKDGVAATDTNIREVSLLLHGNGTNGSTTITDSSLTPKTVTAVGNAQISTAIADPFGNSTGVIAFDGNGDCLTIPSSADFNFGTGDFTVEAWCRFDSAGDVAIVSGRGPTNGRFMFRRLADDTLRIGRNNVAFDLGSVALSWSTGQFYHLATVKSGGTAYLFRDGVQVATGSNTQSYAMTAGSDSNWAVGAGQVNPNQSTLGLFINGYIDDLRITKGVARYTANFTPPTLPFPDF
jgi:hypothetical protein